MQQIIKRLSLGIASLLLALVATFAIALPTPTYAIGEVSKSEVCNSIGTGGECKQNGGVDLNKLTATIINIMSIVIGIVAVVMVMIAGFNFITANGDSSKISTARSALTYAVIGLIIVALAQIIVQFVLAKATNTQTPAREQESGSVQPPASPIASVHYHLPRS